MAGSSIVQVCLTAGAGTTPAVQVQVGGQYMLAVKSPSWSGGSFQLQVQMPDGSFVSVGASVTANGSQNVYIPAGFVNSVIVTTASVSAWLAPIPTVTTR
jgi:hypothetical protein